MRLSRIGLGMVLASIWTMAVGDGMHRAADGFCALSRAMRLTQPSKYKSKPNRISQKKRRLNARRLGHK